MVLGSTGHWADACMTVMLKACHTTRGRLQEDLAWIMLVHIKFSVSDAILPKHLSYTHIIWAIY